MLKYGVLLELVFLLSSLRLQFLNPLLQLLQALLREDQQRHVLHLVVSRGRLPTGIR